MLSSGLGMLRRAAPSRRAGLTRAVLLVLALTLPLLVQLAQPAASSAQGAITVTDIVGRTVTVKAPVERVILGEGRQLYIVSLLDTDDPFKRIVGWVGDVRTTDYDAYEKYLERFPHLADVTVMGSPSGGQFSLEKAIELRPDVVILNYDSYNPARESGLIDTLEKVGIPSVVIDFRLQPLENTVPSMMLMGRLFGKEARAQEAVDFYLQQLNLVYSRLEQIKDPSPNAFIYRAAGLGDCCGTFGRGNLGALIERAGATNIAAGRVPTWNGTVSPELVLTEDPDLIVVTGSNWAHQPNAQGYVSLGYNTRPEVAREQLRQLTAQPGWSTLKAVQSGRFHAIWHQFYNSPYHFVALQAFAKWAYPEQFADVNPDQAYRDFHERFLPIPYSGTFWVSLND